MDRHTVIDEPVRLDVWLWRARFFKTRALAAGFVSGKGVRLTRNGDTRKVGKPGYRLATGDIVSFPLKAQIVTIRVLSAGTRRGPATEARTLYESLEDGDKGEA
ncbi:RNA-binding S4 domain-containing protein [Henriciella aquimarina]|uniref:RNA-binding S4 domain-containing protein n=1 Tax=Henriciella aquimarina TaxID=545261 RepID=UPI000A05A1B9|nr:S4 domain-containing protein [Henriciella aquimarina]